MYGLMLFWKIKKISVFWKPKKNQEAKVKWNISVSAATLY